MHEKQRERWRKIRRQGKSHHLIRGTLIFMLGAILGSVVWRFGRIYISGKPYGFLFESFDIVIAGIISAGIVGYWQSLREWKKSEKAYTTNQLEGGAVINKGGAKQT